MRNNTRNISLLSCIYRRIIFHLRITIYTQRKEQYREEKKDCIIDGKRWKKKKEEKNGEKIDIEEKPKKYIPCKVVDVGVAKEYRCSM